jgi:hypothetical protein
MNLAAMNKNSSKTVALNAVLFSCFGGIEIGFGIHQLMIARVLGLPTLWRFLGCDARPPR